MAEENFNFTKALLYYNIVLDLSESTQPISGKSALNIISEIEILIDVITTRLVECRKLRLDEVTSNEIKILEVCAKRFCFVLTKFKEIS